MEFIAATIAFGLTFATVILVDALSPSTSKPAKRKPEISEYSGPRFTPHGREVIQTGRRVL